MSSASESKLSYEELKQRNAPAEMMPPANCPTSEQWAQMLAYLDAQYQTMEAQRSLLAGQANTMKTMLSTLEKLEKATAEIASLLQQAGKKNERKRLRLPQIDLLGFMKGVGITMVVLVVLAVSLSALAIGWTRLLRPLLALLL